MNTNKIEIEIIDKIIDSLRTHYKIDYLFYTIFEPYGSNNLAEANIYSNTINFSPKLFHSNIGSGYKLERDIQSKHNLSNIDFIKWIVCHEYAHIFYKEIKHTKSFFNKVEEMYLKIK